MDKKDLVIFATLLLADAVSIGWMLVSLANCFGG